MMILKLRIRIKIEQKLDGAKHIQFDIGTLRDNLTLLTTELTERQTAQISPNRDILPEGGARIRYTEIKRRGTKTWDRIDTQLNTIR